eukprot:CAMPEP_0114346930 /NCGR_PEP_ID=MMETSP0101-20121206/13474_1 /TAXON_ID=38822 ORGANISM="Pteridomonas danica, Strain PT" /NCGR_SAMPLE_ID=MMETSP0101 /ASSEMBLY_ACC=CAM_ASM_000211 /LENGTH=1430 /DNA_ID=CAMNT_0001483895 /DNA_START=53 /DNA_END=4345 /DNA_ORIENTATION=+
MAMMMMNAANMAYQKAIKKTRDKQYLAQNHPVWMQYFAENLPEKVEARVGLSETKRHRKKRILANSERLYNRIAWFVYSKITSQVWFEVVILVNILCIGAATGIDLENNGDPSTALLVTTVSIITTTVFTFECIFKIVAEGYEPMIYFTDPEDGKFNTLDFSIVAAGYAFMGLESGGAIGVLRMLRLVRLLTFIKGVPQLRAIIAGLVKGMQSVTYIVMLLVLIIYLFAIMGVLFFGENDPARFGSVATAMITLFQVSTLASWTSIAYTSWYGCGNYNGDPYASAVDPPSNIVTAAGILQGFKCGKVTAKPISTFLFFSIFVIVSAWVIMSLFIGVISMGMFEAFEEMKGKQKEQRYRERLEENQQVEEEDLTTKVHGEKLSLKQQIDMALEDKHRTYIPGSRTERNFLALQQKCIRIRDDPRFSTLIVVTIVLVGVMIGVDTDQLMHCVRYEWRVKGRDDDGDSWCGSLTISMVIGYIAQGIFTIEAGVKILAEGFNPSRYFNDRQNGSWNRLDFFIVIVGFLELSPAKSIFEAFPIVVLRLLRLMRVFRLAKALPRLRSIVDALLSGFGSVGWICILMVVFNYIAGCMCMLCFQKNDPVHFGSVGRSMFTVFRIETLDSWDQVLYIAMYGCSKYPGGYELLSNHGTSTCEHSHGTGFMGAGVFFVVVILGAYVMPTVLIGIVSINFDEANRRAEAMQEMDEKMERIAIHAKAVNPVFFTDDRFIAIRTVFDSMDADGELTLDVNEMAPFYQYVFDKLFGVDLDQNQTEALFHLMDMDGDTELGFAEFVLFIVVIKNIELKCREDPDFALQAFPPDQVKRTNGLNKAETWKKAMEHMDEEAIDEAWKRILHYLNPNESEGMRDRVRELFVNFDSDRNEMVDLEELGHGLTSLGILINSRQIKAFSVGTDTDDDGYISFQEFHDQVKIRANIIQKREEAKAMAEAQALLKRVGEIAALQPAVAEATKGSYDLNVNSADGETKDAGKDGMNDNQIQNNDNQGVQMIERNSSKNKDLSSSKIQQDIHDQPRAVQNNTIINDKEIELNEIVTQCARRLAKRFLDETYKRKTSFYSRNGSFHQNGSIGLEKEVEKLSRIIADRVIVEFAWFGSSIAKPSPDEFSELMKRTISLTSGNMVNNINNTPVVNGFRVPNHRPTTPPLGAPTIIVHRNVQNNQNIQNQNTINQSTINQSLQSIQPQGMHNSYLFSHLKEQQKSFIENRSSKDLVNGGGGGFFSSMVPNTANHQSNTSNTEPTDQIMQPVVHRPNPIVGGQPQSQSQQASPDLEITSTPQTQQAPQRQQGSTNPNLGPVVTAPALSRSRSRSGIISNPFSQNEESQSSLSQHSSFSNHNQQQQQQNKQTNPSYGNQQSNINRYSSLERPPQQSSQFTPSGVPQQQSQSGHRYQNIGAPLGTKLGSLENASNRYNNPHQTM